jgi:hypothetical protein
MWEPQHLTALWAPRPVTGIPLLYFSLLTLCLILMFRFGERINKIKLRSSANGGFSLLVLLFIRIFTISFTYIHLQHNILFFSKSLNMFHLMRSILSSFISCKIELTSLEINVTSATALYLRFIWNILWILAVK